MMTQSPEEICQIFYDSWNIPLGIFRKDGKVRKLYFTGGARLTRMYLEDADALLLRERKAVSAALLYDDKGSCWGCIPLEEELLLLGPVQTGRNSVFPYEGIPEQTWDGMRSISRCLLSLLRDASAVLEEKESSYTESRAAKSMLLQDPGGQKLDPFDEIFLCVITGDLPRLNHLIEDQRFLAYLDWVMTDLPTAKTVFQFNLAKTYHCAQQSLASLDDLSPLVELYLKESSRYQSLAAYKAGSLRMLYDFTRYIHQYRDQRYSPLVNQAILHIRESLYTQIAVEEIARHCMVSLSTLQHRFKEETGMSVKEKIRAAKIERSCFFLRNTDLSCSDVAFRMGYGSQSYFIKQFQKVMGITPAEYKIRSR